jgi:hypothetical protein
MPRGAYRAVIGRCDPKRPLRVRTSHHKTGNISHLTAHQGVWCKWTLQTHFLPFKGPPLRTDVLKMRESTSPRHSNCTAFGARNGDAACYVHNIRTVPHSQRAMSHQQPSQTEDEEYILGPVVHRANSGGERE